MKLLSGFVIGRLHLRLLGEPDVPCHWIRPWGHIRDKQSLALVTRKKIYAQYTE